MKTPQILFLLACLAACTQQKNDTTSIKIDTLVRSEFRTMHKSITEEDRRTKSLTYFVEINKDSSEFALEIKLSKENGLTMSTYHQPKYSKNLKSYEQRLSEVEAMMQSEKGISNSFCTLQLPVFDSEL
jgi:phosphopantetheine adenylyltransferase